MQKEDIIHLESKLCEAIKTNDVEWLDSILHDDLLFIAPNGEVITKQMDLDSHRAGGMIVEQLIPAVENINMIADTAITVVVYDTRGTMMGNPIQGRFRYIRIWKQVADSIKVVGGSCTQLS